jgi:phosphoserine aminotransferase
MTQIAKPAVRPADSRFSSGPTKKRPGWSLDALQGAVLGRSHRSKLGKARLKDAIDRTREILGVPADYRIGITPGSDTGAVELAMWSMLGPRKVDVLAWESFGEDWVADVAKQLKLEHRVLKAPYGELPDLYQVDFKNDVIFTWNGTTSGVRVPNADWIPANREGLTFCDATSAVFAQDLDWAKLDVVTFSWQKVLGGEGAHGMIILSPRAAERVATNTPAWPMPKIFRIVKKGGVDEDFFQGATINTPSMLCVEDYLDALKWTQKIGGLEALLARANSNLKALEEWSAKTPWVDFLASDPKIRSNTSVCLKIVDPRVTGLDDDGQAEFAKKIANVLEKEGVALDVASYRAAPPGLRIWCGATVDASDVEALTPWLEWAFQTVIAEQSK